MKQSVYKFELSLYGPSNERAFAMPKGAEIVSVGNQREKLMLWVRGAFDNDNPEDWVDRTFVFVGTGHKEVESHLPFIGTVQFSDGALVVHVFEVVEKEASIGDWCVGDRFDYRAWKTRTEFEVLHGSVTNVSKRRGNQIEVHFDGYEHPEMIGYIYLRKPGT